MDCCHVGTETQSSGEETLESTGESEEGEEKCEAYDGTCADECGENKFKDESLVCPASKVCCMPEEDKNTCSGELTSCKKKTDCTTGTILDDVKCENGLSCCEEDECLAYDGKCRTNCNANEVEDGTCVSGAKCCYPEE